MKVRTEAKREAILLAAAEVFRESGFEGASMAEIAARLGGSKGTLYSYFKSKEVLFVEVMNDAARKQFQPMFAALSQDEDNLQQALQEFGEGALTYICSDASIQTRRALLAESGRTRIGSTFYENGPRKGSEEMAVFLKHQMECGRLRQADPLLAAHQLIALLECETLTPMLYGAEAAPTCTTIKVAVERALNTFFAAYGSTRMGCTDT